MNKNQFIHEMNQRVKLVRTEYGFTQETMAHTLGLSKKTLVEIEKGRSSLGWMGAVTFCTIFSGSQILSGILGGDAAEMILALAFDELQPHYPKTMGGRVWWRTLEIYHGCSIQQNLVSFHYRALNQNQERLCASYKIEAIRQRLDALREEGSI